MPDFYKIWKCSTDFDESPQHLSFIEIHLVEAVLLHAEKQQTDGTQQSLDIISATMQTRFKT